MPAERAGKNHADAAGDGAVVTDPGAGKEEEAMPRLPLARWVFLWIYVGIIFGLGCGTGIMLNSNFHWEAKVSGVGMFVIESTIACLGIEDILTRTGDVLPSPRSPDES
jgi:hypothetical protein